LHTLIAQMAEQEAIERAELTSLRRCSRQRRASTQARQAQRPHQPTQLQGTDARRPDPVPHP